MIFFGYARQVGGLNIPLWFTDNKPRLFVAFASKSITAWREQ
jgi:hypothetical protein